MLNAITLLLICQYLGFVLNQLLQITIAGPILGALICLIALILFSSHLNAINNLAENLFKYLPLFLVPASIELINYFDFILNHAVMILSLLILSLIIPAGLSLWLLNKLLNHRKHELSTQ